MDDLDIQTAQLIIQLARDDLYQLDDISSNDRNDGLSDLEFALAEQEREFMQYWSEYGGTQIHQDAGLRNGRAGGSGDNMLVAQVAGPSRNPNPSTSSNDIQNRVPSPQLPSPTPINLIDNDDDDDFYINPYEPIPAASSSNSNVHHNVVSLSSLQGRAASPALLISIDSDGDELPAQLASSSSDRNHNLNNDNDPWATNLPINAEDQTNLQPTIDEPNHFLASLMSMLAVPDDHPSTNDSVPAPILIPSSELADDEDVEPPRPSSPVLDQLLLQLFAVANSSGNQASSISSAQAGPSNPVPQKRNTVSAPIRPDSPDSDRNYVEGLGEYSNILRVRQPRAAVGKRRYVVTPPSEDEELSDEESISGILEDITYMEPNVECHFCKDACPISTTINTSCNHRLCRGCISRLVGICIKDETAYPPKCCGNRLQPSELRILLDHSLRRQFEAKTLEYDTPIPVRVYCYRCGEFLDSNSSTITTGSSSTSTISTHTSKYCNVCFVQTCVSCKQPSHPTRECQDTPDEKALKGLAKQQGWQTCPSCNAVVELRAGCYHVMCRCSAQFCYLCATAWKECNCPAFDEDRLLAMAA